MDTRKSVPVVVRRAGPRPVVLGGAGGGGGGGVGSSGTHMHMHGGGGGGGGGGVPHAATATAGAFNPPAPSAPSLAASIRAALETPLVDACGSGVSMDPPAEAPRGRGGGYAMQQATATGDGSSDRGSDGGSDGRPHPHRASLALVSQQDDYFGAAARDRDRHAAIARVHGRAVDDNASAAAALFGTGHAGSGAGSGVSSPSSPHLISAQRSMLLSARGGGGGGGGGQAEAGADSDTGDEPPAPAPSPSPPPSPTRDTTSTATATASHGHGHGSRRSRRRRRRSSTQSQEWGATDTAWIDSQLGVPVGSKVAFDASRPNVVGSDSDDDE